MRYPVIVAGSIFAGALSALPAAGQTAPPLAYVQPVAPQAVQDVQSRLRQVATCTAPIATASAVRARRIEITRDARARWQRTRRCRGGPGSG